ncbi:MULTISPECIES: MBL fold metallo-hydrolase [Pontibacillus]|uniref:MBL fold metallo-hydrolase n=1 Tax=Pontibacillus chungwhensis TaxID=265426 RepID=A0ABY8UWE8_9BACI|nr:MULTISPECIES: MBL fold metallo-hydrolase [Pontibacillus]MCD5323365.1 MBL fold metallo-hydrolase [Pontibacillus sp. HN14]WIF96745.1 MBL fold metallo-hydrolase [Pontibacillus chungwhensis]
MRIRKDQNIYQLTYMPNFFPVNCYLVEEEDHLVLIDAALSLNKKAIIQAAKDIGKPIQRILLTHVHSDHIGALDGIVGDLQGIEVLIPRRESKILEGDLTLEDGEGANPIKGGVPKNVRTRPDRLLSDGDEVGSLVAIDAPGHTPGQMAYLDKRSNSLIAGDAFQTRGGLAVAGDLRLTFPFPALATWDKEVALHTAVKLLSYQPAYLGVGHGNSIKDPSNAIEKAIQQAKRSLEKGK